MDLECAMGVVGQLRPLTGSDSFSLLKHAIALALLESLNGGKSFKVWIGSGQPIEFGIIGHG